MAQVIAKTLEKKELASGVFKLKFFAPQVAKAAMPGQFVHIRCGENQDYILRRPFSIHQITGADSFEILFNVVGLGTRWLADLKTGDTADIIGPLGKGFDIEAAGDRVMLVAGGMGIAPLIFLASKLVEMRAKITTVVGAANKERLLEYMDLKRLSYRIQATTEDGSQGVKGRVTDILTRAIADDEPGIIYACGPKAMLREISLTAQETGIRCQVAMEELMACGVGACLSCVTATTDGYKKVCFDGPVFESEKIRWDDGTGS